MSLASPVVMSFGGDQKKKSWMQVAEVNFLPRVTSLSLGDRVKSVVIQDGLRVEPLVFYFDRNQLRWFRHLIKMPSGCLLLKCSKHVLLGGGPGAGLVHAGVIKTGSG